MTISLAACLLLAPLPTQSDLTVVDALDGSPVPAIALRGLSADTLPAYTGADGRTRLGGTAGQDVADGSYDVVISDGAFGAWSAHKITLPAEGPIPITIGPLFFFDFPDWIPEELRPDISDTRVEAEALSSLEVYAVDSSGARVDVRGALRTQGWPRMKTDHGVFAGATTDRWVRFARPLSADYDELQIRWEDASVEARAKLARHAGMGCEITRLSRVELGGVRFLGEGPSRLLVLKRPGGRPHSARHSNATVLFERLEPGTYTWRLGPLGQRGDVVVKAGQTTEVRLPEMKPTEDAALVEVEVPEGVPVERLTAGIQYSLDGWFVRQPLASPGGIRLAFEFDESGTASIGLPRTDAETTGVALGYSPNGHEYITEQVPIDHGVLRGALAIPADPPRTRVRLTVKPGESAKGIQSVHWSARGLRGQREWAPTREVWISLPADRPTSIDIKDEELRSAYVLFDPASEERSFEVEPLRIHSHSRMPVQVTDRFGAPIAGVEIVSGGERTSVTDANGRGWVLTSPEGRFDDWTVALNDPSLTPVWPATKRIRAEYTTHRAHTIRVVLDR